MRASDDPSPEPAVRAPRRPTADPRRFLVPDEFLPPGFGERLDGPDYSPEEPRPAATVVLARPSRAGTEVLLLRRPRRSGFAAGAWVFPGGMVDAADRDADLVRFLADADLRRWARRLGLAEEREAQGYLLAALREAWEETGILLGEAQADADQLRAARRELLAGDRALGEILERAGIRFSTDDLLYVAHWITPEPEPRRYDTRFFLARVHAGAECLLEGDELAEARWVRPEAAVADFQEGTLNLLPPTVDTLRRLSGHSTLDDTWEALRDAPVKAILPRMRRDREGVVIEY